MRLEDILFIFEEDNKKESKNNNRFFLIKLINDVLAFGLIFFVSIFIAALFSYKAMIVTANTLLLLYFIRIVINDIIVIRRVIKR